MGKLIVGFIAGTVLTGSLFQFNIGIPTYDSKKVKEFSKKVKDKRAKITSKSIKKIAKRTAAAAIPLAGAGIVLGLGVQEYCDNLEDNILLSNIANDDNEPYSLTECSDNALKEVKAAWSNTNWSFNSSENDKVND
jgi:hypothetical protein